MTFCFNIKIGNRKRKHITVHVDEKERIYPDFSEREEALWLALVEANILVELMG